MAERDPLRIPGWAAAPIPHPSGPGGPVTRDLPRLLTQNDACTSARTIVRNCRDPRGRGSESFRRDSGHVMAAAIEYSLRLVLARHEPRASMCPRSVGRLRTD
jgi:hypothetical protein